MTATVATVAYLGLEARAVEVQVQLSSGLPAFVIVGLPDKAVAESRERVRAALAAIGLALPPKRITVNLSPADLPKEGSHYDLPIALGLLAAIGAADAETLSHYVAVGELSLDGRIAASPGVLLAAIHASSEDKGLICPASQGSEAAWAGELDVIAAPDLLALLAHLKGATLIQPPSPAEAEAADSGPDLAQVKGQEVAKRALEIAAAGGHNLLMSGPPGAGKSLLAACLPGILPPLEPSEALEVSMVASVAGELHGGKIRRRRPYRAPHHSASMPALVGGGLKVRPGEISLAHLGVLFLDELPEFKRSTLEVMRQPVEDGKVTVSRAAGSITFPSEFMLVAAMNPCPCGYFGDLKRECRCSPVQVQRYRQRISGPLLDRIDLHIEVPAVEYRDVSSDRTEESSNAIRERISLARERQRKRFGKDSKTNCNARMSTRQLKQHCRLTDDSNELIRIAMTELNLSARAYDRILKVSRTIADLESAENISAEHVSEAIQYRSLDRTLWV